MDSMQLGNMMRQAQVRYDTQATSRPGKIQDDIKAMRRPREMG
jgi:hypothetical protein